MHTNKGKIGIIAENGRMASASAMEKFIEELGGGNVIDGPALRWLAKEAKPRKWICDGHVTGEGDKEHPMLTLEAMGVMGEGSITRIPSIKSMEGK